MNFIGYAHAMGGGGGTGAEGGQASGLVGMLPLVIMFAIFYFLLIRPQQKKAKQHKEMLGAIKKGDRVISSGGLHGTITGLTEDIVTMEIAPKIRVKVSRGSISGLIPKG